MAVALVVFCGPLKRLIEERITGVHADYTAQSIDKKLKNGYRDKPHVLSFVTGAMHHSPGTDTLPVAGLVALVFFFLLRESRAVIAFRRLIPLRPAHALYLYFRRLQI